MAFTSGNSSSGLSIFDGDAGLAQNSEGVTIKALVINALAGIVIFVVQVLIWSLLKSLPRLKGLYQPKTYLVPLAQRWKVPPNNPFKWFLTLWGPPDKVIMQKCGLDTYLFLRYLTLLLKLFVPLAVIILPILLPINKVDGTGTRSFEIQGRLTNFNVTGLDAFSWQNVSPVHTNRFWAHLVLALVVIVYALYLFYTETLEFIRLRQEWLTSPQHRLKASASTVLITGIPEKWSSYDALDSLYDVYPGGIRRIWVNRNYTRLADMVARRDVLLNLLEEAELQLIQTANKKHINKITKDEKKNESAAKKESRKDRKNERKHKSERSTNTIHEEPEGDGKHDGDSPSHSNSSVLHQTPEDVVIKDDIPDKTNTIGNKGNPSSQSIDDKIFDETYANDSDGKALWMNYAKKSDRHTIRILRWGLKFWTTVPAWPLLTIPFSKSVDTIYYTRKEIAKLTHDIENEMQNLDSYPRLGSAFIQFNSQMAAHMACAMLSHHTPGRMNPRYLEIAPLDIIWNNLSMKWYERYLWQLFVFLTFLCILFIWGIPVTFTGFLSQLGTLRYQVSWLKPFRNASSGVISILAGPLPPILLQLLVTAVVPSLLRYLCGLVTPTYNLRELHVQAYYFTFLFVELVLVVSISEGVSIVVPQIISNPEMVPTILAKSLPKSSNYFFNFMVLHALSISASALLQLPRLLNTGINHWLGGTPRQIFIRHTRLPHHTWGSFFPFYTVFAVIGLIYCIISPLILVFIILMFSLFWVAHRNNSFYVTRQLVDTGGLLFARAIQQLFTGIYFMEAALIGLFFLVRDAQNNATAKPQAIIMIVALVLTAVFHFLMNRNLGPYFQFLPITLEDDAVERSKALDERRAERLRLLPDRNVGEAAASSAAQRKSNETASTAEIAESVELQTLDSKKPIQEKMDGSSNEKSIEEKREDARAAVDMVEPSRAQRQNLTRLLSIRRKRQSAPIPRHHEIEAQLSKDPIGVLMTEYNDKLEDISQEEIDAITQIAFTHPATQPNKRVVWIPDDDLGVSKDEIQRTADFSSYVAMDNRWATLAGPKCKVQITHPPPDFSEYWLVENEL